MRRSETTVKDLATTAVITVTAGASVHVADAKMRLADVRHLPVVDGDGRLMGILSNRDVYKAMGETNGKWIPVTEIMSDEVLSVRPATRAYEAAALMLDRKIGSLPIVDDDARIIGIVTETDFLRVACRLLGGDALAVDD